MLWDIVVTDQFEAWLDALSVSDSNSAEQVVAAVEVLKEEGPNLSHKARFTQEEKVATTPWDSSKYVTPDNKDRINEHKDRMLPEIRAYRLREAREQQHLTQQQVIC